MAIGDEDSFSDKSFISKYIRDDNNEAEANMFKEKFKSKESGTTEVFGSIGEGESFLEGSNFNKRWGNKDRFLSDNDDKDEKKTKFTSGPVSKEKEEFLKEFEDESLSVDTCAKINHDWGK